MNRQTYIISFFFLLFLFSCKDMPHKDHGPIVIGDSSSIVTEKDKSKTEDLVTDLHLKPKEVPAKDSVQKDNKPQPLVATDTTKKVAEQPTQPTQASLPPVAGLKADFKETSVLIPNINAKQAGNPNLVNANGAVYSIISGNLNGNVLHTKGNVLKVSQRYQSIVVLKNNTGMLPIDALSITTSWESVNGGNGSYPINGLDEEHLEFPKANRAAIRNAVTKAAQRRRMGRKKIEEWTDMVDDVKAANQKPLHTMLRSVMWKIDGRDANGKPFSKQIRIDVPM